MNIIEETREGVIRDNNTAQNKLKNLLETHDKGIIELRIDEPLHGELDLSIFEEMGFKNIQNIYLGKGEITGIRNFPPKLLIFECIDNLLVEVNELPNTLQQLDLQYNYLNHIDLYGLSKLFKVNLSHNKLESIENLPANIEEVYCINNKLKKLPLAETQKLRVLHVSQNPNIIIENVPKSLVDLKMEDNPFTEVTYQEMHAPLDHDDADQEEKMTYHDALHQYFKLKHIYETELYENRKNAYNPAIIATQKQRKKLAQLVKPKCINCKRPVGTIFSRKDEKYIAICGDTNAQTKCGLNIKLDAGSYTNHSDMLYLFREKVESMKESIIIQKLDTLFNYINERQSVHIFKKELEDYNFYSSMYKELYEKNVELHYDPERKDIILRKQKDIFKLIDTIKALLDEYKKTDNKEFLRNAVEIQVKELNPEIENIRRLKYEWMEVETDIKSAGPFGSSSVIEISNKLVQRDVNLSKNDYTFGEQPKLIHFSKTGK
jgi:hypothetical protein